MRMYRALVLALPLCLVLLLGKAQPAAGQVPVVVQPAVPAVVNYVPERRGLFGRRTVYRPVVTPAVPVAVPVAPVKVAYPVAVARLPVVAPPVATYHAPVVVRTPPASPRVRSYYAPLPVVPIVEPVTTYRLPVNNYYPVVGY